MTADAGLRAGAFRRIGRALRERTFRWWFAGQVTSSSGVATQTVALSWTVLQVTGSAVWLGALAACTWGPSLLFGPWAGALVDRSDRRRLLIATQTVMMSLAAALFVLALLGGLTLPVMLGVSLLAGIVGTADAVARQVYIVDLVGRDTVASAIGLWEVAVNASRVVGPGLGGLLLATSGAAACFGVNALAYLAPLCVLVRMTAGRPPRDPRAHRPSARRGAVRAGLRYASRTPLYRVLLPLAAAGGMIFSMGVALPPFVSRTLHLSGGGYGAMMAAFGVGGLPGALLAAAAPRVTGRRVRALALCTAGSVALVAGAPGPLLALAGMVLLGGASIWFITSANTLAQLHCDSRYRGRVMSLWGMAITGTAPATGLAVGVVVETAGPRLGFAMSGLCVAAATLAGWRVLRDTDGP